MELESNITVVKLEHGLKFSAHSEFGLPDNFTVVGNSTTSDSEDAPRQRRSNTNGEVKVKAEKKKKTTTTTTTTTTRSITKKKTTVMKKTKKKVTTRKVKKTTRKMTTKKAKTTTTTTTTLPPRQITQNKVPDQRNPQDIQAPPRTPTTRRTFVMYDYEDYETDERELKKEPKEHHDS
ncbi:unnamed protein product [Caenorhabditis sp. 36 PRJEB53466]|nr:unnamed protein product [Caenorhabditis sp. 36 PRJEB53466]